MSVFGTIFSADVLEEATIEHLKTWLPTYLGEVERQRGLDPETIPAIRSWEITTRFERKDANQIPAGIVISEGLAEAPERSGDGSYSGWWHIGLGVVAAGAKQQDSNRLAKWYGAALRTLFLQQPGVGGVASGVRLVAEPYTEAPPDYLPVGAAVLIDFHVFVDDFANDLAGPASPVTPPASPGDWPLVEDVIVETEVRSLT